MKDFCLEGRIWLVGKNLVKDLYRIWQQRGCGRGIQQTSARQNYEGIYGEIRRTKIPHECFRSIIT